MSFAAGVFSLVAGNPVVTGTVISSTWANNTLSDIASGLSTCILKDGTQVATSAIPFAQGITIPAGKNLSGGGSAAVSTFAASGQSTLAGVTATATVVLLSILDISATSAGQISFPATQNPSTGANVLDDYEEGVWIPVVRLGGTVSGMTFASQAGFYTKTGRQVNAPFLIQLSAKGSATGAVSIGALPFQSGLAVPAGNVDISQWLLFTNPVNSIKGYVSSSVTSAIVFVNTTAVTANVTANSTDLSNSSFLLGVINYLADS